MSGKHHLLRVVGVTLIASVLLGATSGKNPEGVDGGRLAPAGSSRTYVKGETVMRNLTAVLALVATLGTAATSAWATAPEKNGQLVFRRYLDATRTTGALFTATASGSSARQLTHPAKGVVDQQPDWSPDGGKVAFERKVPCPAGGPRNGLDNTCDLIYTVGRDGKGLSPLVPCDFADHCHGVNSPAWSPDGTKIAFRYGLGNPAFVDSLSYQAGIWIEDTDGSGLRQVTQLTPGRSWDSDPQWSPDGRKLVFARADLKTDASAVFTVNLDGTDVRRVTPWRLNGGDGPDWSPDGRWILFRAQPRDTSSNVFQVHPDGSGLRNLTKQSAAGFHYLSSSFSPDGRMIASARTPGTGSYGAADLVVMSASGADPRPVAATSRWESAVDWGVRS